MTTLRSPSLRGSGLKSPAPSGRPAGQTGLPLYEGVDWNRCWDSGSISIYGSPSLRGSGLKYHRRTWRCDRRRVSLFTREWIEITVVKMGNLDGHTSPSLRGSGLKLCLAARQRLAGRLPLYEGVDWNQSWKHASHYCKVSPSLRGSGLKLYFSRCRWRKRWVSLFTREWIEISVSTDSVRQRSTSPSLRGSGLK